MEHPDGQLLMRYAVGQLSDQDQLARLEEHLVICEECRDAVSAASHQRPIRRKTDALDGALVCLQCGGPIPVNWYHISEQFCGGACRDAFYEEHPDWKENQPERQS